MSLTLLSESPFAQGGNRLCFVHPDDKCRCVKVRRPDFSLADRRRKKGFPKNLKPLSSFDDNVEEWQTLQAFQRHMDSAVFDRVSHCYGFVDTDMGKGLVSELIRDENGAISETLKKYLWDKGFDADCERAVADFSRQWIAMAVPSRDLLLHNIVVQIQAGRIARLVVIDGLGSAGMIPFHWLPARLRTQKAERKVANLYQRINTLLGQRGQDAFPGYHGLLLHNDRPVSATESSESNP